MFEILVRDMSLSFALVCVAFIAGCVAVYCAKRGFDSDAELRHDRRIELKLTHDGREG